MKRVFLTFVMAAMLTASLSACTTTPSSTNHATGNGNGSVMEDGSANSRARGGMGGTTGSSGTGGSTMRDNGRYYADDDGDVSGWDDSVGNDIRRATDDMMNGVGNAVDDMTR